MKPTACLHCGTRLEQKSRGRSRAYCSNRCKAAAYRQRVRSIDWLNAESPRAGDQLIAPLGLPKPAGSEDDVARAVLEAAAVAAEMRELGLRAAPALRARCGRVAEAMDAALVREFGGLFAQDLPLS